MITVQSGSVSCVMHYLVNQAIKCDEYDVKLHTHTHTHHTLQRLRQFKVNIREFTDANDDANKFKNRLANALPCKFLSFIVFSCKQRKKISHLAGLEPATFRLTAERANRLRHKCLVKV